MPFVDTDLITFLLFGDMNPITVLTLSFIIGGICRAMFGHPWRRKANGSDGGSSWGIEVR